MRTATTFTNLHLEERKAPLPLYQIFLGDSLLTPLAICLWDFFSGDIYEFTPSGVGSIFASGLMGAWALAFNNAGDLFASDPNGNSIYEFTPEGVRSTFASGLDHPLGLAFQPVPELLAVGTNSVFQLTVSMPSPYHSTIIQASTDLVNWVNIYTNTPPFTSTDSMATNFPCRFYRALLGP